MVSRGIAFWQKLTSTMSCVFAVCSAWRLLVRDQQASFMPRHCSYL